MDADSFLLFYIKQRIERGEDGLQWYNPPYCGEDEEGHVPDNWRTIQQAVLYFEKDNSDEIEHQLIDQLAQHSAVKFSAFKYLVDAYFGLLQRRIERKADNFGCPSVTNLCVPFLAMIAFTGLFARRLAEMDASARVTEEEQQNRRDFRREITQVSIYGSTMLRYKLYTFANNEDSTAAYSWDRFCADSLQLVEHISSLKERETSIALPSASPLLGVVLCGIAAAAVVYFLIAKRTAATLT